MATKKYNLHLKGFVGGYDFDADFIDYVLSKNENQEVTVLIDSLGGLVSTALSVSSAFNRHGNVTVHFVGMNASAATIASLGARRITMDASAMYLVHKCSTSFFEWGNMNADDLKALVRNIEKQRADLDKIDSNIAEMYAHKCKKDSRELLDLMKKGGWLTAQEALEWGFVDELTDYEDEEAPVLTDTTATAMASAGIPLPALPRVQTSQEDMSAIARLFQSLASFFTHGKTSDSSTRQLFSSSTEKNNSQTQELTNIPTQHTNPKTQMNKVFTHVCKLLNCEHLATDNGCVTVAEGQMDAIEAVIDADRKTINDLNAKISGFETEKLSLLAQIEELKKKPADTSSTVVNNGGTPAAEEKSDAQLFIETRNAAATLFNEIP